MQDDNPYIVTVVRITAEARQVIQINDEFFNDHSQSYKTRRAWVTVGIPTTKGRVLKSFCVSKEHLIKFINLYRSGTIDLTQLIHLAEEHEKAYYGCRKEYVCLRDKCLNTSKEVVHYARG